MRFSFLSGDVNWRVYGGSFISKPFNHGKGGDSLEDDFDHYYVLKVNPIEDRRMQQDLGGKYVVSVTMIAPDKLSADKKEKAFESWGITETDINSTKMLIEVLIEYGYGVHIYEGIGNNLKVLLKQAREEADITNSFTFGFRMDAPQNRIGNTGWDLLEGKLGFN